MKVVILVGGDGKRMGNKIKPLLKKKGKTVLSYIIDNLKKYDLNDIYLIINNKKQFKKLEYKTVRDFKELRSVIKEDFLLLVGDSIINIDFKKLINFHNTNPAFATVVTSNYEIPYGTIDNGTFTEKPKQEVAIGIYILKPENLKDYFYVPDMIGNFKTFKFEGEFVHITTFGDYQQWKKLSY